MKKKPERRKTEREEREEREEDERDKMKDEKKSRDCEKRAELTRRNSLHELRPAQLSANSVSSRENMQAQSVFCKASKSFPGASAA